DRHRLHAGRQAAIDFLHARIDGARDGTAVFADQHEDGTEHDFAAVFGGCAGTQFATVADFADVAYADRYAADIAQNDGADLVQRTHLPRHAHQQLFAAPLDVAGADVGIVAFQRIDYVLQRQAVGRQFFRRWRDLVLLRLPAYRVDLSDAGHGAQLRLDDPVLDLAQVGRRIRRAVRLLRTVFGFHRPQIDFAEA